MSLEPSLIGKVTEWVEAKQLQSYMDETSGLDLFDPGFRTESALVAVMNNLHLLRDKGNASVFLIRSVRSV